MGRKRAGKGKHLLLLAAGLTVFLSSCTVFRDANRQDQLGLEKVRHEAEQLRRDVDVCRHEVIKLQQENDKLQQDLEKARKDIERARKVDMEIEEKRRELGR